MPATTGDSLGPYRLLAPLGEGGMGVVYRARDERLGREVAVKVLREEMAQDPDRLRRFEREARAAAALEHPNILAIHDVGVHEGRAYLVTELLEGDSLRELILARTVTPKKALEYGQQVANGLAAAHERGISHRDLKPENLFLTKDGLVKILDFGLARFREEERGDLLESTAPTYTFEEETREGVVMGTVGYMAPEQVRGLSADHRADIFALGVVLYELLSGQRPFHADTGVETMAAILNQDPSPLTETAPGVSPALRRLIEQCLEKRPDDRFQSARDLALALGRQDEPELTHERDEVFSAAAEEAPVEDQPAPRSPRWSARWLWSSVATAAVLAVFLGSLFVLQRLANQAKPVPEPVDSAASQPPLVTDRRPRIVVLPFENLGPPDTEYFAAGMTEEITSRLAQVAGLAVISRTTAVGYDRSGKTVPQIGVDLGVSYLLEGTVRWEPSPTGAGRVRVTPQLIRVADDTHLWTDRYDDDLEGVFAVQSSIAGEVLHKLEVALEATEQLALESRPTANLDAYQAYLLARHLANRPHFSQDDWQTVVRQYQKAVELDPEFAVAWAELSRAHSRLYRLRVDASPQRAQLAREAADRATHLSPDSPDTHLASAYVHLWVEGDREAALAELTAAGRHRSDSVEILTARSVLLNMQGRWEESRAQLERAFSLSPLDASIAMNLGECYWILRQSDQALAAFRRCVELVSDASWSDWPHMGQAFVYWSLGNTDDACKALKNVGRSHEFWPWVWYWQKVYEEDWPGALEILDSVPSGWIEIKVAKRPVSLFAAVVHLAAGEPEQAQEAFAAARVELEAALGEKPDDPHLLSSLGLTLAGLGERDSAVAQGQRGAELHPMTEDAFYAIPHVIDLAHIHTLLGQDDLALDRLEYLLSVPSWLTPALYRMDPRWDRLRDHPRFQKMIAEGTQ